GRRLAELHVAMTAAKADSLAPEPIGPAHVRRWTAELSLRAKRVYERLADLGDRLREADGRLVDQLATKRAGLPDRLNALLP
ncbi:hypothetical protein OFN33_31245, partial [Escherichia coli]|nr:hypothetical protein [Escherichia coli]